MACPDATPLRSLPQVQRLLESTEAASLVAAYGRTQVLSAVRRHLKEMRAILRETPSAHLDASPGAILAQLAEKLEREAAPRLRRVINATGIVLHTNLGRAPLAPEAVAAAAEAAANYMNLEYDLETGQRGSRYQGVLGLLCELTGAEAALVVNNNAAAVLLALAALAVPGEAVVSRGELVEIGGSFRVPEVIAQSGARLIEVGTTNKTRIGDYERAIGPDTRILLKVHPSNYRIQGFTAAPERSELALLARECGLVAMEDLGSGSLIDLRPLGLPAEPTVRESLAAGIDLVTCSGDKLLGGPQAGLILGRAALIARLKAHPLLRALRLDKMTLGALEATLKLYRSPELAAGRIPVLAMLSAPLEALERRAESLRAELAGLPGVTAEVREATGFAGGGALPEAAIPTRLVALHTPFLEAEELTRRLRLHRPAVVGRIKDGQLLLDLRTVSDAEVHEVAAACRAVLA
ncbi:L-seryl-tRNA(Sec) selenium transferase [Azospirillum sp. SYSU D00513]|uniref:L-seryl-tRNA(Sec) selenium transferase n=1 Tax=Azospirillum sp. SYSU D00513 TaxID=2812561 RepID=UPI001A97CD64|nr:L-seryl-tRNA(Sec) selenium transferase [Azospirillum sp. SYSU D00513]